MTGQLTHIDADGRAKMVDVSDKPATHRRAWATGRIRMSAAAFELARSGRGKGDVRAVAEIAGVMAGKRTSDLIPMCHPILLSSVKVRVHESTEDDGFLIEAEVATTGPTGVEMEALTAVSIACLTIYDMLKAADRGMRIEDIRLVEKSGGASGSFSAP